jgi:Fe-S-cluster containining protein
MREMNLTPNELIDILEDEMAIVDKVLVHRLGNVEKNEGRPVSCRSCPHPTEPGCCFQKTMAYAQEGLAIARYLRRNKMDTPELREKLRGAGAEMEGSSREDWFHNQRRPCVFLSEGKCSIYPVRPHACRTYFVISDPAQCQPGVHDGIWFLDVGQFQNLFVMQTKEIHRAIGLKEGPRRIYLGAMPKVVHAALVARGGIDAYRRALNRETWPAIDQLDDWLEGKNPYGEKLVQIRKRETPP